MLAAKIAQYVAEKYGVPLCDRQGALNIVYIEGANLDGTPNADRLDEWNDGRYLIGMQNGKWEILFSQTATTEPGRFYTQNPMNKAGAARIGFGYHPPAWGEGLHRGIQPALVQRAPVRISRDANRDGKRNRKTEPEFMTQPVGINHHSTNAKFDSDSIGKHSAGCLVGKDVNLHLTFIKMLRFDPRRIHAEQNKEAYLHDCWVIPGDDFGRFEVKSEAVLAVPSGLPPVTIKANFVSDSTAAIIQGTIEQLTQEMINTTPLFPNKDVKIKKGADPIGTVHSIRTAVGKTYQPLRYRVYEVHGRATWFSTERPVIYLQYDGGPVDADGVVPEFYALTLDKFAEIAAPLNKDHRFWE